MVTTTGSTSRPIYPVFGPEYDQQLINMLVELLRLRDQTTPVSPVSVGWTTSNVTTDRTIDANSTTTAEIADVLCTLIEDLKAVGYLSK